MSGPGTQLAPLPEKFVAKSNPDVKRATLEFTKDLEAQGVVHRVPIYSGTRQAPNPVEDCGRQNVAQMSSNKEDLMGQSSVNRLSDPSVQNDRKFRTRSREISKNRLVHSNHAVVGASIGAIFVGFMAGTSLGGNELFGIIGALVVLSLCWVGLYLQ